MLVPGRTGGNIKIRMPAIELLQKWRALVWRALFYSELIDHVCTCRCELNNRPTCRTYHHVFSMQHAVHGAGSYFSIKIAIIYEIKSTLCDISFQKNTEYCCNLYLPRSNRVASEWEGYQGNEVY